MISVTRQQKREHYTSPYSNSCNTISIHRLIKVLFLFQALSMDLYQIMSIIHQTKKNFNLLKILNMNTILILLTS